MFVRLWHHRGTTEAILPPYSVAKHHSASAHRGCLAANATSNARPGAASGGREMTRRKIPGDRRQRRTAANEPAWDLVVDVPVPEDADHAYRPALCVPARTSLFPWPDSVGTKFRTIGPYSHCVVCDEGTWVSYGDAALCLNCARKTSTAWRRERFRETGACPKSGMRIVADNGRPLGVGAAVMHGTSCENRGHREGEPKSSVS